MTVNTSDVQSLKNAPLPMSPPSALSMVGEARALLDVGSVPLSLASSWLQRRLRKKNVDDDDSRPVIIMLPGFASDQRYMKPLEAHLRNLGYRTEDWGLGLNLAGINMPHTLEDLSESWNIETLEGYSPETYRGEGGVPYLCDRATDRIRERALALGGKVVLIGWSLGGYVAREVARELPEQVSHIITLGAPVLGGPKYTKADTLFKRKGFDLDWIESEILKRDLTPIQQPITAIFSKSDAIVNWSAAIDRVSPRVEHIEVNAPHLGMGFKRSIWKLIEQSLERHGTA